jgi:hypothetical protein
LYGGEEVSSGFVVTGGDGAELFEFGEEVFDQMSCLVEFLVLGSGLKAFGACRDDGQLACTPEFQDAGLGVEALVRDDRPCLKLRQQSVGSIQLTGLPTRQMHASGVAQRIHGHVNLGA